MKIIKDEGKRERERKNTMSRLFVTVAKECVIFSYESGKNNDAVISE